MSRRARSRHSSRVRPPTAIRCQPCARAESTGRPVVISSPITRARLASRSSSGGRVHAVLGVVELLGADHPQPVFEVAERVAGAEDVDPGGDLHRPGQPLVEVQPRLVPLGDLQRLHPADGEHGDVPLLAGHPVDQLDRRAVRGAVALDLLGQGEQVAALPAPVGDRGQGARAAPCTARPSGRAATPAPAAVTRRPRMPNAPSTSSNCSTVRPSLRRSPSATPRPNVRSEPLGERVAEGAPGEGDAQVGLALGVVDRQQVPLGGDQVVGPAGRAGHVGQRRAGCACRSSRAHSSAGNGRVVRRRCSRKPARPAYCSEIADSSASRSASGRNAQRTSGSQYQAVTVFGVNVRWPAISVIASSTDGSRSPNLIFGARTRVGLIGSVRSARPCAVGARRPPSPVGAVPVLLGRSGSVVRRAVRSSAGRRLAAMLAGCSAGAVGRPAASRRRWPWVGRSPAAAPAVRPAGPVQRRRRALPAGPPPASHCRWTGRARPADAASAVDRRPGAAPGTRWPGGRRRAAARRAGHRCRAGRRASTVARSSGTARAGAGLAVGGGWCGIAGCSPGARAGRDGSCRPGRAPPPKRSRKGESMSAFSPADTAVGSAGGVRRGAGRGAWNTPTAPWPGDVTSAGSRATSSSSSV